MGLTESRAPAVWTNPAQIVRDMQPDHPVMAFAPSVLRAQARRFLQGFPGLVTYAVKANPDRRVIRTLALAGITGFDVASPAEIDLIGRLVPGAARHYHNPVRSRAEIDHAVAAGVGVWSVDCPSELEKLCAALPQAAEIAVRFKLPIKGAAYDFGSKFGATPDLAAELLRVVAARGHSPSLTFHPGTQCTDPRAWDGYIRMAAQISRLAGIRIHRLNVGGGFPSHRVNGVAPDLAAIFAQIRRSVAVFADAPLLVCEPGRALCGDAFSLITRIKAVRDSDIFLNDGVYGGLTELPQIGNLDRIEVLTPDGQPREGTVRPRTVFGPTCDSLDRLPGELALPGNVSEGDFVVFHGAGAYSTVTNTQFNGFGQMAQVSVKAFS
ncbi:type III PLP-dependent enzyme [Paracoccus shanxieyensis]|uniref:ornithine decarboxylase n=1 Tax=Paracoccus shanxieyensis TaxID=2675752 RepID=A0A6L6IWV0_9RHOB|nr:type III PLP-dependent enzyme [Paracoccus shanxieyensis]MTH62837.1 type III PLP-dependent enzyme [Paracoccus shanxieyensis]MTH86079.1 type III PLP-dependent enzyme [Paracoccus shanxieyensis]